MKYLKKIFENSKIEALIDAVEEYNKVLKQDNIWKKICAELNWEFIPTI